MMFYNGTLYPLFVQLIEWITCKADSLKASFRAKRGDNIHRWVGPSNNCQTERLARFLVNYFIIFPTAALDNNHRLRSGGTRGECDNTLERTLHFTGEASLT